jgi:uncharacterized membrane protein
MMKEKTYKKALFRRRRRSGRPRYAGQMSADQSQAEPRVAADPRVHEFVARVVVARPRHELYEFLRDFTNAPKFMVNVAGVTEVDSLSSVWTVTDPAGGSAQWEMLVTDEEVDRLIAWSTSGNTPVSYSGRIEFQDATAPDTTVPGATVPGATANVGTEVTATVRHQQHAGLVETLIEAVAGSHEAAEPPVQSLSDLTRFKEYMEGRAAQASSRNA